MINALRKYIPLMVAGLLLLSGCSVNPVTGNLDFMLVTQRQEQRLGKKHHPAVLYNFGIYQDTKLNTYINAIGQKIAQKSDMPKLKFNFVVLDSMDVNAFALPGGYIYITRGLLLMLNSEAELAAVLGHEIAHVTARHAARKISKSRLIGVGMGLGAFYLPELKTTAGTALYTIAGGAIVRGYGREYELESDEVGSRYMAKAGYAPSAMLNVILTLKNHELFIRSLMDDPPEETFYHALFSTHPDKDTRLHNIIENIGRMNAGAATINRDIYLKHLEGLQYGGSEAQGISHKNHFYHAKVAKGVHIIFPYGWIIRNTNPAIICHNSETKARISLIINKYTGNAYAYAVSRLNIERIDGWEKLKGARYLTYTGVAAVKSKEKLFHIRIAVVVFKGSAFLFAGKPQNKYGASGFDNAFFQTISSVAPIKPNEHRFAIAKRIHIKKLSKPDDLKPYVSGDNKLAGFGYLLLINNLYPNKRVEPGKDYKVIY